MPTASNFQNWRERRQARQPDHEQLTTTDDEENISPAQLAVGSAEEEESHPLQIPSGDDSDEDNIDPLSPDHTSDGTDLEVGADENASGRSPAITANVASGNVRRTFTLADLEEEREMGRRRTSFCVLFAVFILFRLWLQAVATGDFFLLMICLMGTSWTARFIRHTREREEELDRLISTYNDNGGENANDGEGMEMDLQRMSFQAQLAMAIIQSQRDMMQGNFGNPDGSSGSQGVSASAKEQWDRFEFHPDGKGYGSLSHMEDLEKASKAPHSKEEDEPHCSICLGEYEEGENLVCLPCKHVYHEDCVSSWCSNHTRCPLCNFDLESVAGDTATTTTGTTSSS